MTVPKAREYLARHKTGRFTNQHEILTHKTHLKISLASWGKVMCCQGAKLRYEVNVTILTAQNVCHKFL
jgi:hypothetical protein